ncbi:MAG: UvrB/UvrC motif-containing protein [Oscillospiraceae bacterium]|nr:UvrB/UvrC motif-containing protein [Oscillospiraceae bacterium]
MLCQNCGRNEASAHIKRVINGEAAESHLCGECAAQMGYGNLFSGFGLTLGDFFGSFLSDAPAQQLGAANVIRCQKCGSSWNDIARDGRAGCADCYRTFFDRLSPSLQRIHGRIRHNGKVSQSGLETGEAKSERELRQEKTDALKKRLDEAVAEQNFETAAKLRDEIRDLEGQE